VRDYQERVLERQVASQDITKISHDTPFECYLKSGAYNRRVQKDSALIQSSSLSQQAQPTSSSVYSQRLPYAAHVFPRIIPPVTPMSTIATSRPETLNPSTSLNLESNKESSSHHCKYLGDDLCHRRINRASGRLSEYYPEDLSEYRPGGRDKLDDGDDCCDDICYECCCVKDGCICCGTSLLIVGLIWLKNSAGSVQE
jgi:hypothetical protein